MGVCMNTQRKLTYEELEKKVLQLQNCLELALADLDIACSEQNGFLKIANPISVDISYEANIYPQLSDKEKEFVEKFHLDTIVQTHHYRTGIWKWRYKDEALKLLKEDY